MQMDVSVKAITHCMRIDFFMQGVMPETREMMLITKVEMEMAAVIHATI